MRVGLEFQLPGRQGLETLPEAGKAIPEEQTDVALKEYYPARQWYSGADIDGLLGATDLGTRSVLSLPRSHLYRLKANWY